MLLQADTKQIQDKLAHYCLTDIDPPADLSRPEVVKHYRRLISNVFRTTLELAYPITEEWLNSEEWDYLLSEFMAKHKSQTPSVWKMPQEFAEFITDSDYATELNKPTLNDLIWLEWYEIEVHTMSDIDEPVDKNSDFSIDKTLSVNPYHRFLQLEYPVHKMNASEAKNKKGNYYVLIYRLIESGQVRFVELSPLHVALLQKISEKPASLNQIAPIVGSMFGLDMTKEIREHMEYFCFDCVRKNIAFISK